MEASTTSTITKIQGTNPRHAVCANTLEAAAAETVQMASPIRVESQRRRCDWKPGMLSGCRNSGPLVFMMTKGRVAAEKIESWTATLMAAKRLALAILR